MIVLPPPAPVTTVEEAKLAVRIQACRVIEHERRLKQVRADLRDAQDKLVEIEMEHENGDRV